MVVVVWQMGWYANKGERRTRSSTVGEATLVRALKTSERDLDWDKIDTRKGDGDIFGWCDGGGAHFNNKCPIPPSDETLTHASKNEIPQANC